MLTLVRTELERHLTRRVTWIAGAVGVTLLPLLALTILPADPSARGSLEINGSALVLPATVLVAVWGYVTAAASVAAEQASGGLGMWLTFHPRRIAVYAAKLVAGTVPTFLFSLIANAGAVLVAVRVCEPSDSGTVLDLAGMAFRGTLVAAAAAAAGIALTMIGRSLLSALGVLVGWLVAMIIQLYAKVASESEWQWLGLELLARGFLFNSRPDLGGSFLSVEVAVVLANGFGLLAVLALLVGVGGAVFARRDVQ